MFSLEGLSILRRYRCATVVLSLCSVLSFSGYSRVWADDLVVPEKQSDEDTVRVEKFSHEVVTVLTTDDRGDKLKMPSGLFFDPRADELYVLNGGDNLIVVYGPDYFPQESLGSGRGIKTPVGGVFTSDGNILIPQSGVSGQGPRLTIINSAFLPVKEISLAGVPELNNFSPAHIAVGKDGSIYLAALESPRVMILTVDGGFSRWMTVPVNMAGEYQAHGSDDSGKMAKIRNVAVDSYGNLFLLSEETSKTYIFDSDGNFLFTFGTKGGAEGKLSRPRALAIDEKKKCIYVVDYMRHTVLVYDFTGAFRYEIGGLGWGPGWFNYPVDIVVGRQGHLVVADFFNQRVQVFEVTSPVLPERPDALWRFKSLDGEVEQKVNPEDGGD